MTEQDAGARAPRPDQSIDTVASGRYRKAGSCPSPIASANAARWERGVGRLTLAVFGTLCGAVLFIAYNVIPFYYYYFELTNQLGALVTSKERTNDAALRKRIMSIVAELGIPADERDIRIDRRDGLIEVSLPYKEIFYVRWRGRDIDLYVFEFTAHAHGLL